MHQIGGVGPVAEAVVAAGAPEVVGDAPEKGGALVKETVPGKAEVEAEDEAESREAAVVVADLGAAGEAAVEAAAGPAAVVGR